MLAADLKAAELRLLVLLQELNLLRTFEAKDAALAGKLDKFSREKGEVTANIRDCETRYTAKKAELEVWQEKDASIGHEFDALVPESHSFRAQLAKIFRRKIKRSKKRDGDADDDDDDEDEDEEEDFDEDEGDEDEEEVDDSCPPGCDTTLYEQVLEMREKRLDQEEVRARRAVQRPL